MANNVNVSWIQVTNPQLQADGTGLDNYTPVELFDNSTNKSTLNFGNVQAGKITNIKCVLARFSGASQVSDLQFWLDSTTANATGSSNTDLSVNKGWYFYYCIVPQDKLNFNFETTTFTDAQKKGETSNNGNNTASYLDNDSQFKMTEIEKDVNNVAVNQFSAPTTDNANASLVLDIPEGGSADSYLIMLDVQTPSDANSGNTEGWYYRMNFLYS